MLVNFFCTPFSFVRTIKCTASVRLTAGSAFYAAHKWKCAEKVNKYIIHNASKNVVCNESSKCINKIMICNGSSKNYVIAASWNKRSNLSFISCVQHIVICKRAMQLFLRELRRSPRVLYVHIILFDITLFYILLSAAWFSDVLLCCTQLQKLALRPLLFIYRSTRDQTVGPTHD
jgi:hypothetical protein